MYARTSLLLVEQPPDEILQRQRDIGQLACIHGASQRGDMFPFGMIELGMQPLAPLLALGEMLKQQAARDMPSVRVLRHADPHQRRDLLGLDEIALRRIRQPLTVERDDPLIPLAAWSRGRS